MEINESDYINGHKIVEIKADPFIKGQIDIITDGVETGAFNSMRVIIYRIQKGEEKR